MLIKTGFEKQNIINVMSPCSVENVSGADVVDFELISPRS